MRRALTWIFLVALVAGVAGVVSYVGARATAGKVIGSNPPVFDRVTTFDYRGVDDLPGTPRAWVFSYERTRLPGVRRAVIYVSITGKLIATEPADLDLRLEEYEKSRQP